MNYIFLSFFLGHIVLQDLRYLSSLIRDEPGPSAVEFRVLATGPPGNPQDHILFICSSVDGLWGYFYFVDVINSAAMNIHAQVLG